MKRTDLRVRVAVMTFALLGGVLAACGNERQDAEAPPESPGVSEPPVQTEVSAETTGPVDLPAETQPTVSPEITDFAVGAGDYYFDTGGITELPAGSVRATMTVDEAATEAHVAMFARVKDGETVEDVLSAAETDFTGYKAAQMVDFVGGVNALRAGASQSAIVDLEPGTYMVVCFIPAQDGSFPPKPHSAFGMWTEIEVVEPDVEPVVIENEGTIVLSEMMFDLPDGFDGQGTFAVENRGALLHEMGIVRLDDGKTGDDVAAFYDFSSGPPDIGNEPDTPGGGYAANHPGQNGYVELDLEPGNYVLVCFVGNEPPSFSTHLNLGMWKEFSIT